MYSFWHSVLVIFGLILLRMVVAEFSTAVYSKDQLRNGFLVAQSNNTISRV